MRAGLGFCTCLVSVVSIVMNFPPVSADIIIMVGNVVFHRHIKDLVSERRTLLADEKNISQVFVHERKSRRNKFNKKIYSSHRVTLQVSITHTYYLFTYKNYTLKSCPDVFINK